MRAYISQFSYAMSQIRQTVWKDIQVKTVTRFVLGNGSFACTNMAVYIAEKKAMLCQLLLLWMQCLLFVQAGPPKVFGGPGSKL